MEKDAKEPQNQDKNVRVLDLFNQILGQHLERLIGTRFGIGGLPLNLVTLSCFIILHERENEIAEFPADPPERFTLESITAELLEIGLAKDEDPRPMIEDMLAKEYLQSDSDGKYRAMKSTLSMSQLLDKIFPKMPGMNLVAYFIQIIEEIQSGRRDLEAGVKQFHTLLAQQGVPLKSADTKARTPKSGAAPNLNEGTAAETKAPEARAPLFGKAAPLKMDELLAKINAADSTPRNILSAETKPDYLEIKEIEIADMFQTQQPVFSTGPDAHSAGSQNISEKPDNPELSTARNGQLSTPAAGPLSVSAMGLAGPATPEGTAASKESDPNLAEDEKGEEQGDDETEESESDQSIGEKIAADEAIARQIDRFQEELALQCPLCKSGKIKTQQTMTGAVFYKCTAESCHFISWGQPYYLPCPQCHNPFLIVTTQKDSTRILKCPRATCRYWQKFPEPGSDQLKTRKVVARRPKRRLVRKLVRKK